MNKIILSALAVSAASAFVPASGFAEGKSMTKDEIKQVVKEYIDENPQAIIDSLTKYQQKMVQDRQEKSKENLSKRKDDLFKDASAPVGGNPDGDAAVVVFYDYNCGYCKKVFPSIEKLIQEDKKVKVIFKEFPILSESSKVAAKAALAVNKLDKKKFFDFHGALMKFTGEKTEAKMLEMAKEIGLNPDKVKKEMDSPEISAYLDKVRELAQDIGVQGTPAFVVGDEFIPGAVDYETLKKSVETARTKK